MSGRAQPDDRPAGKTRGKPMRVRIWAGRLAAATLVTVLPATTNIVAQSTGSVQRTRVPRSRRPDEGALDRYCVTCHNGRVRKAACCSIRRMWRGRVGRRSEKVVPAAGRHDCRPAPPTGRRHSGSFCGDLEHLASAAASGPGTGAPPQPRCANAVRDRLARGRGIARPAMIRAMASQHCQRAQRVGRAGAGHAGAGAAPV
jgi:hypothetical protein